MPIAPKVLAALGSLIAAAAAFMAGMATNSADDAATAKAKAQDQLSKGAAGDPCPECEEKKRKDAAEEGGIRTALAKARRWMFGHFTQKDSNSCVIASSRNMIYVMTGANVPEEQLQDEMRTILAEPDHDFETQGINPVNAVTLLSQHGVQTDAYANVDSARLPALLRDGKPALIGFKNPGHRVMLDSVQTDGNGNRTYVVRDPDPYYGGRPRLMSQQDFDDKYNPRAVVIVAK